MVQGETIQVKVDKIDQYGRTVGRIWQDDLDIEEAMLYAGMAWHYKKYNQEPKLDRAESRARSLRKGLWSGTPIAPWNWRHGAR